MSSTFGKVSLLSGTNKVNLRARSGLAADYTLLFPNTPPGNNQILRWDDSVQSFVWGAANSVTLTSNQTYLTASSDGSGNYTLDFPSQAQRLFLASPVGGAGNPSFRAIADADIAALDASKLTGTIGVARMPNGTDATSWQVGASAGNARLIGTTSAIEFRTASNALAAIICGDITATGTVNFTNVNQVQVGDNIFELNADYVGSTPTENAGLQVNRGTLTAAQFIWDESADKWSAGLVGSLYQVGLKVTRNIVAGDVVAGVVTWTHNTNTTNLIVQVRDASGVSIGVDTTPTNANTVTIDFTGLTVTGTWTAVMYV